MLSVEQMLAQACTETGLSDFGDDYFRQGLECVVDCANRGGKLSAMGEAAFSAEAQRLLVNRLRFAKDLKQYPEILDEKLDDPLIILGLPRTGTTKLQRLIAVDPEMQSFKFWQLMNPAPVSLPIPGQEDPRIEMGRQMISVMSQIAPDVLQMHPMQAEWPDEEIFLRFFTFCCDAVYMNTPAPGYAEWLATQPQQVTFVYMKQLMQYLQWQNRRCGQKVDGRRWVLKTPAHLGYLDVLVDLFPGADYICAHRDLSEVIPSYCRLIETFWRVKTEVIDMHGLGQSMLAYWSGAMRQHLLQRRALGNRINILDIQFKQVHSEPFNVIRDIYRHIGRELTFSTEAMMREWNANDQHGQSGHQRYTLEQYGLDAAAIEDAFGDYTHSFLR